MKQWLKSFVLFWFCAHLVLPNLYPSSDIADSSKNLFTFDELVALSQNRFSPNLNLKLEQIFETPIVSNEFFNAGIRSNHYAHPLIGPFIRVVSWDLTTMTNVDDITYLIQRSDYYDQLMNLKSVPRGSDMYQVAMSQRNLLEAADIMVLQGVSIGAKPSQYRNNLEELAKALKMNYAYGVSYVITEPVYLGLEGLNYQDKTPDYEALQFFQVDPRKYEGIMGNVVLSKFRIKSIAVFPLHTQGYDWYLQEKERSFFKYPRPQGKHEDLSKRVHREEKIGGRLFMRVDLEVPGLPNNTLTVVNVDLEIKCEVSKREAQIQEILSYIKEVSNPVVLAGNFNSVEHDISEASIENRLGDMARDPSNLTSMAISAVLPHALIINSARTVTNLGKNYHNPVAQDIPMISPNPTRGIFDAVQYFKFNDGYTFDFRGNTYRSFNGREGDLANSNQRESLGFKSTFRNRFGPYRLDWIFVKAFLTDPNDARGSYWLAPHFGVTLSEMNASLNEPISSHDPNVVDLPYSDVSLNAHSS